jgi:glycosyltransferase involved in cell wall biosynthesis
MRILWFTSTPSLAASRLNADTRMTGWVDSLEKHLGGISEVTLGVAFPFSQGNVEAFKINETTYLPIPTASEKGKYSGLIDRWKHRIEPESILDNYLKIIDQFRPDLIHVFGSEAPFGQIVGHTKVPVVLQIQGNLSVCSLKYFSGFSAFDSVIYSNKKSFILGYNTWHQYFTFRKRAERELYFMKGCRFVLGRTEWDRYISKVIAPESRYFHCDEILREPFYKYAWKRNENKKFRIFSTLSGSTYKGFETVLKCASLLKKRGDFDFEWNIAGIDNNHEIITITERSQHMRFADNNIRLNGSMTADELVVNLLSSDCFLHPSHIENSPNSVCEAMMLGIPVIATRVGGTPSILSSGEEGILIQDGDPYVMAAAILDLASSPEKQKLFSENSRKKAFQRHDPETILQNLVNIYKSIIKS